MIFHSKEALAERPYDQLGIEGLGLTQGEAVYFAQSLDGLLQGIPLCNQRVFKDGKGYGCKISGQTDYKQAYEDTKKIFRLIQAVLLRNSDISQEYSDFKNYELYNSSFITALKHLNGAKETKEILKECSEATGLSPEKFMDRALRNARLVHTGEAGLEPVSDSKVNVAVEMFAKRSFEMPTLSENIYYGSLNQSGDYYRTMEDIDHSIQSSEDGIIFYKSKMPKNFSHYSIKELAKLDAAWQVYMDFKNGVKEVKKQSWYKEQRKEDIRSLAQERVKVEDGKGDKLAARARENKAKTDISKLSMMREALSQRLGN